MVNLIRSELYRLVKSKCTYILLLILAVFSVLNPFMFKVIDSIEIDMSQVQAELEAAEEEMSEEVLDVGYSAYSGDKWFDEEYQITVADFIQENVTGAFVFLFIAIFAALFFNAELRTGYIKNIITKLRCRCNLALANFAAVEVMLLLMFIVNIIVTAAASYILFDDISFGSVGDLTVYHLVQFLLHSAFVALIQLMVYLTRSTAFSMTTGICISAGLTSVILVSLSKLIIKYLDAPADFSLSNYTISGKIMSVTISTPSGDLIQPIVVGAIWLAAMFSLGCLILKKKDIR